MRITTPSFVLGLVMVWEVFLLRNIAKDWLVFILLLRRVSQDTSCVLLHGYSSCDLGYCSSSSYGSLKIQHGFIVGLEEYHFLKIEGIPWSPRDCYTLVSIA
jgi:hypothetical protein